MSKRACVCAYGFISSSVCVPVVMRMNVWCGVICIFMCKSLDNGDIGT